MTLKLVSKSLPNKYAEQLYKNELNYSSDMNKLNERIELDYLRNSHYIDLSSHVFLNKIRQKRTQWKKDDVRYREYYKTICKNSYSKYLENNQSRIDDKKFLNRFNSDRNVLNLEVLADKANLIQRANSLHEVNIKEELVLPPIVKPMSVEKMERPQISTFSLPKHVAMIPSKPFSNGKYSSTDRDFLESLPEKVELTNTDVGRKYLDNKREQKNMINRVKKNFSKIQTNVVNDTRFKNLVSSLDV